MPLQIAICGAGPAGLTAAILLNRTGHSVTLFDQMDAPNPLGSGLMLQPTGLAVLNAMGLGQDIHDLGHRIDVLSGSVGNQGRKVLDVRYSALRDDLYGLAVHRGALFSVLMDGLKAEGLSITPSSTVRAVHASSTGQMIEMEEGNREGPFDLVINAAGQQSPLTPGARKLLSYGALWTTLDWHDANGFNPHVLEQRYHRASHMVGVLPLGRINKDGPEKLAFFWSLKHKDYTDWLQAGLPSWKREVTDLWPETSVLLEQITDPASMILARYSHHRLPRPYADGLVHIGDSAHSASPQLGQGANMALLDAWALALALKHERSQSGTLQDSLKHYATLRHNHVKLYQAMSWLFTPVYQSDSRLLPALRDLTMPLLSRLPPVPRIMATMVAGMIADPRSKLELAP
ncbi:MAG: NAD(P)/FAD-dependent oxidoreductase [Alphaproteobacteria bacterium]